MAPKEIQLHHTTKNIHTFIFADDQAILARSEDDLQEAIHILNIMAGEYHFEISKKSKIWPLKVKMRLYPTFATMYKTMTGPILLHGSETSIRKKQNRS